MSYLSAAEIARIRALIATKEAQLSLANATYEKLLAQDTEEYRLNTGEGSQWATKRKIAALSDEITKLESAIDQLNRKLRAGGIVSVVLRRQ